MNLAERGQAERRRRQKGLPILHSRYSLQSKRLINYGGFKLVKTLEERITRLEDIEAIKNLKAFYGLWGDRKYTADHQRKPQNELDEAARMQTSVFTEDAIWDAGEQFGSQKGREAIFENSRSGPWRFATHMFLSPVIEVHGSTAHGDWVIWQTATLEKNNQSVFLNATTSDDYVKVDGRWFISRTVFKLKFMTPFDQPWSEQKNTPYAA